MKILLVLPASGKWKGIARHSAFNGKVFRFSMLSLLTLASLTPDEDEITLVDEQIDDIPFEGSFDLVGITVMTAAAPRSYEIAAEFREKGVPVILGGFHPTLNPEEALMHADSIVSGCAYDAWEKLLSDVKRNSLEKIYYGNPLAHIPSALPRHIVQKGKYVTVNATFATLGCRNTCQFCSVNKFYKQKRYQRNIQEIIDELKTFKERFFIFVDDNLTQDREYALDLLRQLVSLNKKWVTQASIEIADDDEMLEHLRKAGCIGLFVGLESFSRSALESQEKNLKAPELYQKAVRKIHRKGIFVESGIIFGFDTDDADVFQNTLKMLDKIGIDAIQASIFTPLPGTPIFERMQERILDRNWEHYDYRHVVFKPARMREKDLQAGADWVIRKFYSLSRILRRSFRWLFIPGGIKNFIYPFVLNLGYYGRVKRFEIKGYNPVKKEKLTFKILIRNVRYSLLKLNRAFRHMQRKEKVAYREAFNQARF